MYSYAGASANGVTSDPVHQPATNRRLGGLAPQAAAAAQSAGTASGTDVETIMSSGPQLISEMPLALQEPRVAAGPGQPRVLGHRFVCSSSSTSALSMQHVFPTLHDGQHGHCLPGRQYRG